MIRIRGLNKTCLQSGEVHPILQNIHLDIGRGEFVAIMGKSGSGKTTLLNILGCMDRFSEGSYRFYEEDVLQMKTGKLAKFRNKNIGFVFQAYHLIADMTALQNVEVPLGYSGLSKKPRRETAMAMLEKVNLADRVHYYPNQLSGGQQQRVAIARALANNPDLILADEPTGNLDSNNGAEIMELLVQLNQAGSSLILVTHDEQIARHASRILILSDGQIVSDGPNFLRTEITPRDTKATDD